MNDMWIKTPNGVKDLDVGRWLVVLADGEIGICESYQGNNCIIHVINGSFYFDCEPVIAYMPIPSISDFLKDHLKTEANFKTAGAKVMDLDDWNFGVQAAIYSPEDGNGYWCPNDNYESDVSVWDKKPGWATHVVWYNR